MGLNRVGQGLEQIPVLPRSDMKTRGQWVGCSRNSTGKMPLDTEAATDAQHDGVASVPVLDQDAMPDKPVMAVALAGRSYQDLARCVRDRHVRGQRVLRAFLRRDGVARCRPQTLASAPQDS